MRAALVATLALVAACKPAPEAARPPVLDATAPRVEATPTAPTTAAAPTPDASTKPDASKNTPTKPTTADASIALPKVVTIGMHVGGGPYDEITKEPMKRSVEPHFGELTRCWTHVTSAPHPADMGVDLVIEAAGGHARVSNPRTQIQGEGFVPCVLAFFESIDFEKPRNGKTVVSNSVRFTPKP
ncbi:MAG: uncharacterized protein JWM74_3781 [Myxococcaceae bacterium]|nr:uncharacterized protein [Myxococcaceae bacterium]